MVDTTTSVVNRHVLSIRERIEQILDLCERGRIKEARGLLIDSAEPGMLLARGVVYYWLARSGSEFTIEEAKNVLTRAQEAGADPGLCRVFLGLCYWRQAQDEEAQIMFADALKSDDPHIKYLALLSRTQVEGDQRRWRDALKTISAMAEFVDSESDANKGKFFNQRANTYYQAFEDVGGEYRDKALTDYEAAREFFERSGSLRHEANTLNNIAFLYRITDTKEAHDYIDRAIDLFTRQGDRAGIGSAKDTKAQIFLYADNLAQALRCANESIELLSAADDTVWLPTSYATRGTIYKQLRNLDKAAGDFSVAAQMEEVKRLRTALMKAKGKVTVAAKLLGLKNHSSLNFLLRKHPELISLRRQSWKRRKPQMTK